MEVNNLKAYLANIGMTMKDFAAIIEVDVAYLTDIAKYRKFAGKRLAKDIYEMTDGVVVVMTRPKKQKAA